MLDDFKYQAKKAVVAAQEAARDMGHDHIGTEHLLLGLQRQPSPVKQALESLGLTDAQVTQQLEDIFGIGPATTDAIPFDPEANAAFDRADEEAAELGQERVGAEHLMFALLDQPESGAVKMLQKMDVDPAAVRPAVVNALQGANDGPSLDEADDLKGDRKPEYRPASKEIGAILVDNGAIDQERLNQALEGARDKLLGRALIDLGLIKEEDLVRALATQIGLDFVDLTQYPIEPWAVQLIPAPAAWRHHVIAIGEDGGKVLVAMSNPSDNHAIDDIRVMTNRQVRPVVAMASDIELAIRTHMGPRELADAGEGMPLTSGTWHGAGSTGPREPWRGPDDAVLGVPVDVGGILAVTDTNVFVAVSNVVAYPEGFSMTMTLRRMGAPRSDKWFEAVSWQHRWSGSGIPELSPRALRVGVEFPDGARVDNLSFRDMPSRRPATPCMISMGAEGTAWRMDVQFWVWPMPPEGEGSFFCEWPSEGIPLTRVPFETGILREASARAHTLWNPEG